MTDKVARLLDLYTRDLHIYVLNNFSDSEEDIALKSICLEVLDDSRFKCGYGARVGSKHAHHAYQGGLLLHTWEVVVNCLKIASSISFGENWVNKHVLLTAAICHDYRKISDYDEEGQHTEYHKLVRHLAGSHADFVVWANKYKLPEAISLQIQHCLLSHHGRLEWEAAKVPETIEAHILHYADMLSVVGGKFKSEPV